MIVGGTKVPVPRLVRQRSLEHAVALPRACAAMWSSSRCCASAVITGPTSTDRRSGSPTTSSAIAPFSIGSTRSAMSSCRQSTRSAEQRWPARIEGRGQHVEHDLLGQRRGIGDQRVLPAGLGDQRGGLPSAPSRWASCRLIERATSVEPVNTTPATVGLPTSRAADRAVAGQELQRLARHAGLVQQRDGLGGDQRRLLGRLGDHRVAGGQRGGDLAGEDRQREIPRADAGDRRRAAGACRCEKSRRLQLA